jgi:hypothetical protein
MYLLVLLVSNHYRLDTMDFNNDENLLGLVPDPLMRVDDNFDLGGFDVGYLTTTPHKSCTLATGTPSLIVMFLLCQEHCSLMRWSHSYVIILVHLRVVCYLMI